METQTSLTSSGLIVWDVASITTILGLVFMPSEFRSGTTHSGNCFVSELLFWLHINPYRNSLSVLKEADTTRLLFRVTSIIALYAGLTRSLFRVTTIIALYAGLTRLLFRVTSIIAGRNWSNFSYALFSLQPLTCSLILRERNFIPVKVSSH